MEKKICSKCKLEKDVCEFGVLKSSKDGFRGICKNCRKTENTKNKEWKIKNQDKVREYRKLWRENNVEYMKSYHKKYNIEHRKKINTKLKNWRNDNKEKYLSQTREKRKEKYDSNIDFKLKHLLRSRINKIVTFTRNKSSLELIGCSIEEFKVFIENQFKDGMNWENYGYYGWHIDHKIPLSSAKTEEEVYKLCHYTNLQPLWAEENLKKSNKIL